MATVKSKGKTTEKSKAKAKTAAKPAKKRTTKTIGKAAKASKTTQPADIRSTSRLRRTKIEEIKKKLQAQKASILSGAEVAMTALPDQTVFPDLGDQASVECDMSFMLRLKGREQRLLKKIDEALDRIESGIFGICDVCGEEIDINRLCARPVTTMCIHCKTEQEAEEKLMGA